MKRDNTMTRRYLADAGISQGMRVLEIGCGDGEVTQILAELVGPTGAVVAIDLNERVIAGAQGRMSKNDIAHVRFLVADLAEDMTNLHRLLPESFDVLAGRRVLMYLRDPARILRRLSALIKTGGLVVFEEADLTMMPARKTPLVAHDSAVELLRKTLLREGVNTAMGLDLPNTLMRAQLHFESIRAEAVIEGQGTQYPLSTLLELMGPRLIAGGGITKQEIDALAKRVEEEGCDPTRTYISSMSFCGWGHKL
jgi:SAM-dependent methyltransferase